MSGSTFWDEVGHTIRDQLIEHYNEGMGLCVVLATYQFDIEIVHNSLIMNVSRFGDNQNRG